MVCHMQDAMLQDLNRMTTDQDAAVKVLQQYGGERLDCNIMWPLT